MRDAVHSMVNENSNRLPDWNRPAWEQAPAWWNVSANVARSRDSRTEPCDSWSLGKQPVGVPKTCSMCQNHRCRRWKTTLFLLLDDDDVKNGDVVDDECVCHRQCWYSRNHSMSEWRDDCQNYSMKLNLLVRMLKWKTKTLKGWNANESDESTSLTLGHLSFVLKPMCNNGICYSITFT